LKTGGGGVEEGCESVKKEINTVVKNKGEAAAFSTKLSSREKDLSASKG